MTPISICVIAKNEEKHMERFLSSIKKYMGDYPHEIVVTDTGSTDKTISIAQKYTDKIFHFEWINDYRMKGLNDSSFFGLDISDSPLCDHFHSF